MKIANYFLGGRRGILVFLFGAFLVMGLFTKEAHSQPFAYIANSSDDTVSVIDTATNTVVDTVSVGSNPIGVAVTPNGEFVYVANESSDNVSVIRTSDNTVVTTVAVGDAPRVFGLFIGPAPAPIEPAPTLSQWGFIAFALFSGLIGIWFVRKRRIHVA